MEVPLPIVSMHALSRKTLAAAGASSSARLFKAAAKVGAGCPSFGGQRTTASVRTQESTQRSSKHLPRSETQNFKPASLHRLQGLGAFSEYGSAQAPARWCARPALVSFAIQMQGKVVARRAWPNPSFKRTRLRRSA